MDKKQVPGIKDIIDKTIRIFSNSIPRFDLHSSSDTLNTRERVQQFLTALKTLDEPARRNFKYSLLSTRELMPELGESIWKRYLFGEKLSDTETFVKEHRTELNNLLFSSGMETTPMGSAAYNLGSILRELNLPHREAGNLFLEKVRNAFIEDIQTSWFFSQYKEINAPLPKDPDILPFNIHDTLTLPETKKDVQQIVKAEKKNISLSEERSGDNIRNLIRLLERIREQASHYATNLVALLDVYLDITQQQAEAEERMKVKQMDANERIIFRALDKLNPEDVVDYLSRIPFYMNLDTNHEIGNFGTAIVPKFKNRVLNEGFQKLWHWIIEQTLISQLEVNDNHEWSSI